jgi:hypothetical protein
MRTRVRSPRILGELLNRSLNAYILAAGATVAALANPLPADAEAVCVPSKVILWGGGTFQFFFPGQKIAAFNIAQTHTTGSSITSAFFNRGFLIANTADASAVITNNPYPADLSSAAIVGPTDKFGKGNSYGLLFTYAYGIRGGRGNLKHGVNYLGLKFSLSGQTHYGWARMRVTTNELRDHEYLTVIHLQAVGYETVANQPIQVNANCKGTATNDSEANKAQSPVGSLGNLALGTVGTNLRRQQ